MKKLSIEEKAKAYDEALEQAKRWHKAFVMGHNYPATDIKVSYEIMFPELTESEDEKIRKEIIDYLSTVDDKNLIPYESWIAWLEKQGEQESADKVEQKFNVGEWVVYNNDICQIVKREEGCNKLVTVFGIEKELVNERNLSTAHLWTIEDAKDGDVLVASDKSLFIYNGNINENGSVGFHIAFTEDMNIILNSDDGCGWEEKDSCRPVTKEQYDALMKAIDDAGYTWDAEKKKLKKVIKFKVGDWIINNKVYGDVPVKIKEIGNYLYLCERQDGVIIELNKNAVLKEFKYWDITDAKDGDVLVGSYGTFIFMGENNGYCGVLSNNAFIRSTGNNEWTECLHPATKEQREQLENAMTDAGWEFDFEEKELKKIGQNSAWGEEDDRNLSIAIQYVFQHGYLSTVNWLKSLKQRIGR